jgi:hypothetical protein
MTVPEETMPSKNLAMRNTMGTRIWTAGVIAALLLAGCGGSATGPQAWIDAPQHNSTHPVAPMEIVLHGADPGGVAAVELSVNGEVLSRRPPDDASTPLVIQHVDWDPQAPGEYVLTARAQNHAGAWSPVAVANVTLTGPEVLAEIPGGPVILPSATFTPEPRQIIVPTWTPTPACVDKAGFVADVRVPDNTLLPPGGTFHKIWRLRNDGTCPWTDAYQVVFSDGDPMNNNTPLSLPGEVQPGDTVDIGVDMVAPSRDGTYRGNYLLQNPQGATFGVGASGQTPFYVQIVVGTRSTATLPPPPQPDTQPPSVSISHTPSGSSVPTGNTITFTANASDNVGVTRIDIWVTAPGQFPALAKTCNNTTSCSYTGGPYNTQGNLSYFAIAADAAGHETNSGGHTITIYIVIARAGDGWEGSRG